MKKKLMLLLLSLILVSLAAIALIIYLNPKAQFKTDAEIVGKKLHNFRITTLSGKSISLDDYKGKALIINIWDTKCPPCIAEFPGLIELYSEYKLQGLEILGLTKSLYEDEEGLKKFIKKYGLTYDIAIVDTRFLNRLGGVRGIPVSYIVDTKGILYKRHIGYRQKSVFEEDIKNILPPVYDETRDE